MLLLAQFEPFRLDPGTVVMFVLMTLVFLFLSGAVVWTERSSETRLMLLGLLVAIMATGYSLMIPVPTVALVTPLLMRIAVMLVLGSIVCSIVRALAKGPNVPPAEPPHA